MAKRIVVNVDKCLACKSCELACALAHSQSEVLSEAVAESPRPQRRVTVEAAGGFAVPLQCRHCEDAPCITICPTEAIHRCGPEGPVLVDQDRCIGCNFCLMVCPFGVIEVSNDGKAVVKCDLCLERTKTGEPPACVAGCPTGALKFEEVSKRPAEQRRAAARQVAEAATEAQRISGGEKG